LNIYNVDIYTNGFIILIQKILDFNNLCNEYLLLSEVTGLFVLKNIFHGKNVFNEFYIVFFHLFTLLLHEFFKKLCHVDIWLFVYPQFLQTGHDSSKQKLEHRLWA
jgi:hypothetical protein